MLPISEIASRQRLEVFADGPGGANRLFIYTGIAVIDPKSMMWFLENKLGHETVDIILGQGSTTDPTKGDNFSGAPQIFINGTVSVGLAAVTDQGDSDNVGWATDWTKLDLVVVDSQTKLLRIRVNITVQGEQTALLRISYTAFIAAWDSMPDLVSLAFEDQRIVFDSNKPWSKGTVTLSGPAPSSGVPVQLSTDRPDLLMIPATVTVANGATQANFNALLSVKPGGTGVVKAQVAAEFGKGRYVAILDLL